MERIKKIFTNPYFYLFCIIVLYTLYFSYYTINRYNHFYNGIFDIGNMNQTLYNTLHGHFFMETDPTGHVALVSRFSDHADFFLFLIAPIYDFVGQIPFMLFLQSFVVALGTIPIVLYAKEKLQNTWYGVFFALLYLLLPSVENPNVFEWHAVTLGMTFLLFSFYFTYKRKYFLSVLFTILALSTKEEVGFTLCFMYGYFFLSTICSSLKFRDFRYIQLVQKKLAIEWKKHKTFLLFSLICAICSFLYSYILITVVIPHLHNGPSIYLTNYPGNSRGVLSVLLYPLEHPNSFIQQSFSRALSYAGILTLQLGGLSLFSPLTLLIALPEFVIDVFSLDPQMQSIFFQYPSVINAFVILSAISGFIRVGGWIEKKFPLFSLWMLFIPVFLCVMWFSFKDGDLPYSLSYTSPAIIGSNINQKDIQEVNALASSLSPTVSISADNNLGSHLSSRTYIYRYPVDAGHADYMIVKQQLTSTEMVGYSLIYKGEDVFVYKKD